jgi:uncharacterized damage-inducible protein DinB
MIMIGKEDIDLLYRYNRWANGTVLKTVATLSVAQFNQKLGGSFPSVRETLVHLMGADWIWLRRWKGTSPSALLSAADFPDLDSIKSKWRDIEVGQADFVRQVTDLSLKEPLRYVNLKGQSFEYPLGRAMQHLVNHGTYHRGQVTNFLRQLGAQPAATDLLVYFEVESKMDQSAG